MRHAILLLTFIFGANLYGSAPSDTFRLANEALEKGSTEDAIHLYQTIADKGYGSYELFFNLGTAYASKQNWYDARLNLERAYLLHPAGKEVNANLEFVKAEVDDMYHFPRYPLFGVIETIHSHLGYNFPGILLLLVFLGCCCLIYLYTRERKKTTLFALYGMASLLLMTGVLIFFQQTYNGFHSHMAIVENNEEVLYQQPDKNAPVATYLKAGYKVRINETVGPWAKVDLADGTVGWVLEDHIKKLSQDFNLLRG